MRYYINKLREKWRAVFNVRALKAIGEWIAPVRFSIGMICLLNVIASGSGLAVTLVTRELVDSAVSRNEEALWKFGLLLTALIVSDRLLTILEMRIHNRASARLQQDMQRLVTERMLFRDYAALKPYHSGELLNRVFSDAGVVKNGVMNILPSLIRIAVSFVGAAVILITMDWRFVPVFMLASLIGLAVAGLFRKPMKLRHKRMQEAEDGLRSVTQETLENIGVVKASRSEQRVIRQMEERRNELSEEQVRNGRISIVLNNGMGTIFDLSWLLCYLWGCLKIFRGEFSYGSLAAMLQLIGRVQRPIANAAQLAAQVYSVVASAERLLEVIDLPEDRDAGELTSFERVILDRVSFRYADGKEEILENVSVEIHRGDFIALTGLSGAGKTSLFQLLLGIYRPTSGTVLFTDGETKVRASRGTRGLFAYVPQGNTLFSGTLRDNLTRFSDSASEEEIMNAAETACIGDLVRGIGLDAVLGERGIGLSEGQAQRVAVARALLSGAPILLLDEATSALDEETEARLLSNISGMKEKTVLIVTHRRAALGICGVQWRVEKSRIVCTPLRT